MSKINETEALSMIAQAIVIKAEVKTACCNYNDAETKAKNAAVFADKTNDKADSVKISDSLRKQMDSIENMIWKQADYFEDCVIEVDSVIDVNHATKMIEAIDIVVDAVKDLRLMMIKCKEYVSKIKPNEYNNIDVVDIVKISLNATIDFAWAIAKASSQSAAVLVKTEISAFALQKAIRMANATDIDLNTITINFTTDNIPYS